MNLEQIKKEWAKEKKEIPPCRNIKLRTWTDPITTVSISDIEAKSSPEKAEIQKALEKRHDDLKRKYSESDWKDITAYAEGFLKGRGGDKTGRNRNR